MPASLSLPLEGELVSQGTVYCLDGGLPKELTQGTMFNDVPETGGWAQAAWESTSDRCLNVSLWGFFLQPTSTPSLHQHLIWEIRLNP